MGTSGFASPDDVGEFEHGAGTKEWCFKAFVAGERVGEVLLGLLVAAEGRGRFGKLLPGWCHRGGMADLGDGNCALPKGCGPTYTG